MRPFGAWRARGPRHCQIAKSAKPAGSLDHQAGRTARQTVNPAGLPSWRHANAARYENFTAQSAAKPTTTTYTYIYFTRSGTLARSFWHSGYTTQV